MQLITRELNFFDAFTWSEKAATKIVIWIADIMAIRFGGKIFDNLSSLALESTAWITILIGAVFELQFSFLADSIFVDNCFIRNWNPVL